MVIFLLKHLRPSIPFLISSDRLQRKFLKHVLHLFGQGETKVRVQAVLFLRQMAVQLPPPFLSLGMKVVSWCYTPTRKVQPLLASEFTTV